MCLQGCSTPCKELVNCKLIQTLDVTIFHCQCKIHTWLASQQEPSSNILSSYFFPAAGSDINMQTCKPEYKPWHVSKAHWRLCHSSHSVCWSSCTPHLAVSTSSGLPQNHQRPTTLHWASSTFSPHVPTSHSTSWWSHRSMWLALHNIPWATI